MSKKTLKQTGNYRIFFTKGECRKSSTNINTVDSFIQNNSQSQSQSPQLKIYSKKACVFTTQNAVHITAQLLEIGIQCVFQLQSIYNSQFNIQENVQKQAASHKVKKQPLVRNQSFQQINHHTFNIKIHQQHIIITQNSVYHKFKLQLQQQSIKIILGQGYRILKLKMFDFPSRKIKISDQPFLGSFKVLNPSKMILEKATLLKQKITQKPKNCLKWVTQTSKAENQIPHNSQIIVFHTHKKQSNYEEFKQKSIKFDNDEQRYKKPVINIKSLKEKSVCLITQPHLPQHKTPDIQKPAIIKKKEVKGTSKIRKRRANLQNILIRPTLL